MILSQLISWIALLASSFQKLTVDSNNGQLLDVSSKMVTLFDPKVQEVYIFDCEPSPCVAVQVLNDTDFKRFGSRFDTLLALATTSNDLEIYDCSSGMCIYNQTIWAPNPVYSVSNLKIHNTTVAVSYMNPDQINFFDCSFENCTQTSTLPGVDGTIMAFYESTLAIGVPAANNNRGLVQVYDCSQALCNLTQTLATDPEYIDQQFGATVVLYDQWLAIRAVNTPYEGDVTGAVFVYNCLDQGCVFNQVIYGQKSFGWSIDICPATDPRSVRLVIGARSDNYQAGVVYVYECSENCTSIGTLSVSDPYDSDYFGTSVGCTSDLFLVGSSVATYALTDSDLA